MGGLGVFGGRGRGSVEMMAPAPAESLLVVPLEFYFTEQIIWLTGMVSFFFQDSLSFSSPVTLLPSAFLLQTGGGV